MGGDDVDVSAAELGEWLGDLSDRSVRELAAEGIIPKSGHGRYPLRQSIADYCSHLREVAAGRQAGEGNGLDLVAERARLAKEQADGQALKNAEARGQLLPRAEVDAAVMDAFRRVRAALLKLAPRAAPKDRALRSRIADLIHEALEELAGTEVIARPGDWDGIQREGGAG